jgi:hypothetical protein
MKFLTPKGEKLMRELRETGERRRQKREARIRAQLGEAIDHSLRKFAEDNPELVEKLRAAARRKD